MGLHSSVEGDGCSKLSADAGLHNADGTSLGCSQPAEVHSAANFHAAAKGGASSLPGLDLTDSSLGSSMLPGVNYASAETFDLGAMDMTQTMLPGAGSAPAGSVDLLSGGYMLPGVESAPLGSADFSASSNLLPGADSFTSAVDLKGGSFSLELNVGASGGAPTVDAPVTHNLVDASGGAGFDGISGTEFSSVSPAGDLGGAAGGGLMPGADGGAMLPGADAATGFTGMESFTGQLGDMFSSIASFGNPMGLITALFQFLVALFSPQNLSNLGQIAQMAEANMLALDKMKALGG